MDYLKYLKFPLSMGALIFGISVLTFWKVDFYAVLLTGGYVITALISDMGGRYFDLTQQSKSSKYLFKMIFDPPSVFLLLASFVYSFAASLPWILFGTAAFIAVITFAVHFSDWYDERRKKEGSTE